MNTLIILGMHRSGTSCLTGCLQQLGLSLGQVSNYNDYNLKGNKEDDRIGVLNESILNYSGGTWKNPPSEVKWKNEHVVQRDEILNEYNTLAKPFGIKDPRMLFTLDFWRPALSEIKLLGAYRHPMNVANSLYARENIRIEIEDGLKLWSLYNSQLLALHDLYGFDLINFDLQKEDYLSQVIKTAEKLGLCNDSAEFDFFESKLRKQNQSGNQIDSLSQALLVQYNKLKNLSTGAN